ncbi:MAG: hypothetical protein QM676_01285 [Novosphingobium sp.]
MSGSAPRSLKRDLGCVGAILLVIAAGVLLHYLPVMQQKWLAKDLIRENLDMTYRGYRDVTIVKSSDRSNYAGLFNLAGLAKEYWDFCLLVDAKSPSGRVETQTFRAGGDRAKKEMTLRKVPDFDRCRSDQAG